MECVFLQCRGNGCPCILLQGHGCSQALTWQVVHPTRISPCDLLVFEPRPPRALPGRGRLVSSLHLFVPCWLLLTAPPSSNQFALQFAQVNKHLLEGKGNALDHRLTCQSSNKNLRIPLMIFSLPGSALALLQPSRITGAFVRAQQPSGGPGGNNFSAAKPRKLPGYLFLHTLSSSCGHEV